MDKFYIYDNGQDNTDSLQKAIYQNAGKATIVITPGTYKTKHLDIISNTHIIFEKGAILQFNDSFEHYTPIFSRWEGVDCYCMHPLFFISNAENVIIEGNGTLDGSGKKWWDYSYSRRTYQKEPLTDIELKFAQLNPNFKNQPSGGGGRQCQFLRPPLVQIFKSSNITLKNLTLTNSPFWTLHTLYSKNLKIANLNIINPYETPNTDGMDIESCSDVEILDCFVDVGDDGIALKSGSGSEAFKVNKATKNVLINGCIVKQAHGGFVIGSETAGGVNNVEISNCEFLGTDRGIRIKTRRGRAGNIHDIYAHDIIMKDTICPITINMYYRCGSNDEKLFSLQQQDITELTPIVENIKISNIKATNCKGAAGFIAGLPESRVKNLSIENSLIEVRDNIEPNCEVEMYNGIPDTDYRGFRVFFADLDFKHNKINTEPQLLFETN